MLRLTSLAGQLIQTVALCLPLAPLRPSAELSGQISGLWVLPMPSSSRAISDSDDEKGMAEDEYEISDVVACKFKGKQSFFKILWKGYPKEDATWEPESNILAQDVQILKKVKYLQNCARTKRSKKTGTTTNGISSASVKKPNGIQKPPSRRAKIELKALPALKTNGQVDNTVLKPDGLGDPQADVKIISMRQRGETKEVLVSVGGKQWISVKAARKLYVDPLLDYLLDRVVYRKDTTAA